MDHTISTTCFQDYFNGDGKVGRRAVDSFLILTQLGFCSIYFIFISQNIKTVVENYYPETIINIKVLCSPAMQLLSAKYLQYFLYCCCL